MSKMWNLLKLYSFALWHSHAVTFTTPLGDIISRFGLGFHQYADDTQIYIAVRCDDIACVTSNLAAYTSAVYDWLFHNRLALNPERLEAAMFGTALCVQSLKGDMSITVAGASVKLSHSIKNVGVVIDENLIFDEHVLKVCRFHITGLWHIRAALAKDTKDTACTVASAVIG